MMVFILLIIISLAQLTIFTTPTLVETDSSLISSSLSYGSSVTSNFRTANIRLTPPALSDIDLISFTLSWPNTVRQTGSTFLTTLTCARETDAFYTQRLADEVPTTVRTENRRSCVNGIDIHILVKVNIVDLCGNPLLSPCNSTLIFSFNLAPADTNNPETHSVVVDWNPCSDTALKNFNDDAEVSDDPTPPERFCAAVDIPTPPPHSGYPAQDKRTWALALNYPALVLEELPFYDYGSHQVHPSLYPSTAQVYPPEQAIPELHFRIHMTIPRPLLMGSWDYYFEILSPHWFEFSTTGFHDPLLTRQNVHFPPQYPNHPEYAINHREDFRRTFNQQQLLQSNTPYCLLSHTVPVEISFKTDKPHMFKITINLDDIRQMPSQLNAEAMKFISVRCFNFALKTFAPVGYRTHHAENARVVEIMAHQFISVSSEGTKGEYLHNEILRNDAFSFLSEKQVNRTFHPQLFAPAPIRVLSPTSLECVHQMGHNAPTFVRCVISDVTGTFHRQLKNIKFFFTAFDQDKLNPRFTVRQLNLANKMHLNQNRRGSEGEKQSLESRSVRSKYVPLLAEDKACETSQFDGFYLSQCTSSDSSSSPSDIDPNRTDFVEFDPSAPIIVDFFITDMPPVVRPGYIKFPTFLFGFESFWDGRQEDSPHVPLMYPVSLFPNLSTTSAGLCLWNGSWCQPLKEMLLAYRFDIIDNTSHHYRDSFQYEYQIVPPAVERSESSDVILQFIHVFFPTRNLIFETSSDIECFLDTKPYAHRFAQFYDHIAANLTQIREFTEDDFGSSEFDPSYADVLILDLSANTQRVPMTSSSTFHCNIVTARNPIYMPRDEPLVQTHALVSIVFQSQRPATSASLFELGEHDWNHGDNNEYDKNRTDLQQHRSNPELGAGMSYIFSQNIKSYTFNAPADAHEIGYHPFLWALVAAGASTFLLLIIVTTCFNRDEFMALLKRFLAFFCCNLSKKPPTQAELGNSLNNDLALALKASKKGSKYSEAVQKKIMQRRLQAAIKANQLTHGDGPGRFDIESNRFITPAEQRKAQQKALEQIQKRQVQLLLTSQSTPLKTKKQKAAHAAQLAEYSRDQDEIAQLLANKGPCAVPLASELDSAGKLRKRRGLYR